jgi:hypothetical protein
VQKTPDAMRLFFLLLAVTVLAGGQTTPSPESVLDQAKAKLQAMAQRLEQYVCMETIDRGYYRRVKPLPAPARPEAPDCDGETSEAANSPWQLEFRDRVKLEVTVSEGRELHSWPGATRFDTRNVDDLIRDGPVSTGSFGAYLTSIFGRSGVSFQYTGQKTGEHGAVLEYRYRVPLEASRYEVKVGGAWLPVAYEGEFWINPQSLELERLTIRASDPPRASVFCSASTTLNYQSVRIGDGDVLLPSKAELEIVQKSGEQNRNVTSFSACREYHAESEVSFDVPTDGEGTAGPRAGRGRVALPIGLPVMLALESAVDTETASAGDPISAKVVKAVGKRGSSEELIPAGAVVRGRIRRVEHHLLPEPYFLIAFAFNRVEVQGAVSAFVARSEPDMELAKSLNANLQLRDTGIWFWGVGTFLFPTSKPHYVIPAGFESKWFTLATGAR